MECYVLIDKRSVKDMSKAVGFQMPGNPKFLWVDYDGAMKFWRSNPEVQAKFNIVKVTLHFSD